MARSVQGTFVVAARLDGRVLRVYGNSNGQPIPTFTGAERIANSLKQSERWETRPDVVVLEIQPTEV